MAKTADAFKTISEVAEDLDLPQHVLRFWETRFSQIKPLKRGGGRRYYRPEDVGILRGIKHLLYGEGYTIKGVQRIFKDQGVRYVASIWQEEGDTPGEDVDERSEETSAQQKASLQTEKQVENEQTAGKAEAENGITAKEAKPDALPDNTAPISPAASQTSAKPAAPQETNVPDASNEPDPSHPAFPSPTTVKPGSVAQPDMLANVVSPTTFTAPPDQMPMGSVSRNATDRVEPSDRHTVPGHAPPHISIGGKTEVLPRKSPPYLVQPAVPAHLVNAIRNEQLTSPMALSGLPIQAIHEEDEQEIEKIPNDILSEVTASSAPAPQKHKGLLSRFALSMREEAGTKAMVQELNEEQASKLQETLFELLECKRLLDQIR